MWYNNRNAAIVRLDRLIQRRKFGKGAISILRIWYNHTMCGENLTTKTVLQDLPGPLLAWYRANARDLPWRRTTDPYQIWVSEIMLQQTRVAAVLGYYARFLETFPTVEALAAAPEERLMKLWEGLGYYSRARNLQKAARIVAEQGGRFPDTYQDLLALPGVGDYTASAIASAAFGQREAAVDGNVLRVVMRLTDCRDDIADPKVKKAVRAQIQAVMPEAEADIRVFNQATMELGATVCAPNGHGLLQGPPSGHGRGSASEGGQKAPPGGGEDGVPAGAGRKDRPAEAAGDRVAGGPVGVSQRGGSPG